MQSSLFPHSHRKKKKCDNGRLWCKQCTLAKTSCVYGLSDCGDRTSKLPKTASSVLGRPPLGIDTNSSGLLKSCGGGISFNPMTATGNSFQSRSDLISLPNFSNTTTAVGTLPRFDGLQPDMISEDLSCNLGGMHHCFTDLLSPLSSKEPCQLLISNTCGSPSHQKLIDHFCYTVAPMTTLDSGKDNQLAQFVVPLIGVNLTVLNAVCALAGAHLEQLDQDGIYMSPYYRRLATRGVESQSSEIVGYNYVATLTSILLLIYYEAVSVQFQMFPNLYLNPYLAAF